MKKTPINSIKSLIYGIIDRITGLPDYRITGLPDYRITLYALRVGVMAMSAFAWLRRCLGPSSRPESLSSVIPPTRSPAGSALVSRTPPQGGSDCIHIIPPLRGNPIRKRIGWGDNNPSTYDPSVFPAQAGIHPIRRLRRVCAAALLCLPLLLGFVAPVVAQTVSFAQTTVHHIQEGKGPLVVQLNLSAARTEATPVNVSATPLTATGNGVDYSGQTYRATFPAGATTTTISVPITADNLRELGDNSDGYETFRMDIHNFGLPTGVTVGNPNLIYVRIYDAPFVKFERPENYTLVEGGAPIEFELDVSAPYFTERFTGGGHGAVHVQHKGGASIDSDYTLEYWYEGLGWLSGKNLMAVLDGEAGTRVRITALQDGIKESTETTTITLLDLPQVYKDLDQPFYRLKNPRTLTFTIQDDTPNTAPTVLNAIPDQSATAGTAFTYAFPANTFNDADSDSLTYSALKADNSALPSWLTFTTGTRTFSGTPQSGDVGTLSVKVTANDGNGGSISDTFSIVVSAATVPTVTVTGPSPITEGENAVFTFNVSPVSTANLPVNVTPRQSGGFFHASALNVTQRTISAGNTSQSFRPSSINDAVDEPDGSVTLTVNIGSGYTVGNPSTTTIVVKDNDPTVVSLTRVDSGALNEGDQAEFTVSLGRALVAGEIIDVPLTIGGTNVTPADWSLSTKTGTTHTGITLQNINTATPTVRFAGAGAQTAILQLTASADTTTESTETFTLALGNNNAFDANALGTNVGGGADPHSTDNGFNVTVNNVVLSANAPVVDFASATSSVGEDAGTHDVTVQLSSAAPAGGLTLAYSITGSATAGSDYTTLPGTVTVAANATTATIPVVIQDDEQDENNETVILTLISRGTGYTLGSTVSHTLTITDNDTTTNLGGGTSPGGDNNNNDTPPVVTPPVIPPVSVSAQALTLTEGTMESYTLVLDSAPTESVTIEITPLFSPAMSLLSTASVGSTAQDNPRITVTPSTVVFTPDNWQTPQSITVQAQTGENTTEQTVQLIHRIKGSNQRVASVTITIQERVITVSLSTPAQVTEGQTLTVTVTADTTPTVDLPIDVLIRETSDTDYIEDTEEGTKRVTLPAGQDRIRYSLPIRDNDTEDTQAGRVTLTIQPGTGYTVAGGTAQVVITDDEGQIATTPWLSRMGRTLAEQAIEGISARIHAARTPGLNATLAGWSVPMNPSSGESLDSEIHTLNPASQNPASGQTLNAQDILSNSQFLHTTGIDLRGGNTAWWGQVSETDFAGVQHDIHTQGESRTIQLGGDYAVNDWLMGMSVLHNSAEGDSQRRGNTERLESNVTALIPYSARDLGNTHLWGALGIGQGQVSRYRDNIQRSETDMTWRMISAGTRSELKQTETTSMALISDALWVRTESDESKQDNMNPQVSRIRAGLESTWNKSIRDIQIQPTFTIGARHDAGGAESGFGLYASSGLNWTSPLVQIDLEGQYLLSHQAQEIEEKGFSASLIHDRNPNSDLGLSVSLSQRSVSSGGLPSLFTPQPLNITESRPRWMIDAQYGMPAFDGRFTGSPHIGLGLDGDTTDIALGWRMTPLATNRNLSLGIQATRLTEQQTKPKHWFGVEARVRW